MACDSTLTRFCCDCEKASALAVDAATNCAVAAATALEAAIRSASLSWPSTSLLEAVTSCWVDRATNLAAEMRPSDQAGSTL